MARITNWYCSTFFGGIFRAIARAGQDHTIGEARPVPRRKKSVSLHRWARERFTVAKIDVQDYEVVADLDELLASDENNLWDEDSTL